MQISAPSRVTISDVPPADPKVSDLWFDSASLGLYIRSPGNTWVAAKNMGIPLPPNRDRDREGDHGRELKTLEQRLDLVERYTAMLRQAPAERATAAHSRKSKRPPQEHSARPSTLAAAAAFAAYLDAQEDLMENTPPATLARLVANFATKHELDGEDQLKPEGGVMRDMAAWVLAAIRKSRGRA
jgi:hypothetical protein